MARWSHFAITGGRIGKERYRWASEEREERKEVTNGRYPSRCGSQKRIADVCSLHSHFHFLFDNSLSVLAGAICTILDSTCKVDYCMDHEGKKLLQTTRVTETQKRGRTESSLLSSLRSVLDHFQSFLRCSLQK